VPRRYKAGPTVDIRREATLRGPLIALSAWPGVHDGEVVATRSHYGDVASNRNLHHEAAAQRNAAP
jgi:hypothetical protein